jgi:hypothetical protein
MQRPAQISGPIQPLPPVFWNALYLVPAGSALPTVWLQHLNLRHLDPEFETFKSLFLRAMPGPPADAVPCPWGCNCYHKVVPQDNGTLLGVCQCDPKRCGDYTVTAYERVTWEIDWSKLANSLCQAFSLEPKTAKLGFHNTRQIGAWSPDAVPVILTLAGNHAELFNIATQLVSRIGKPFILLAPNSKHLSPAAKELLNHIGALFVSLADHVGLGDSRRQAPASQHPVSIGDHVAHGLLTRTPPAKLFAEVSPLLPEPSNEELARRTFVVFQDEQQNARKRLPTLYTVFYLYCIKELTIPQIARKCRCSVGTVANRLKLLQAKTGVPTDQLRAIAPQFIRYEDDFRQATRNYRRSTAK